MRALLFVLISLPFVYSAQIYGTTYHWENFEPLSGVVVEINTTPEQMLVSRDGSYSFVIPEGSYKITAKYFSGGVLKLEAEEELEVVENGSYRIDLILLPALEEEFLFDDIDISILEEDVPERRNYLLIAVPVALILLLLAYYLHKKRGTNRKVEEDTEEDTLPEDLAELLDIIKDEGGRIKQKELRKRLGCSEAKLSLMLADLEHRGRIKKIKKGRGNIIIIK